MRKLLLTGTALVGSIGLASAQTTPAPVPMTSLQGSISSYNGVQAGNNNQNSDGSTPAPGPFTPTPGTVVIHLNARVNTYAAVGGGSFFNYTNSSSYASQFVPNKTTAPYALGTAPTGGVLVAGTPGIGGGSTYSVAQPYGTA